MVAAVSVAAVSAESPMAGTAVSSGRAAISVGEPVVGTSGNYGSFHLTQGNVQGVIEIADPASVDDILNDNIGIRVYPNPVRTSLNIDRVGEAGEAVLTLYSDTGALSLLTPLTAPHHEIDASSLAPGIYILTIDAGSEIIFTTKIIKH